MNTNLFTEEEIQKLCNKVIRLEKTIEHFKKYDEERKQYYKEIVQKVGQLEAYIQELEDTSEIIRLNKIYKQQLSILNNRVFLDKVLRMSDISDIQSRLQLRENLKSKDILIKNLREANTQLILELNRLKKCIN